MTSVVGWLALAASSTSSPEPFPRRRSVRTRSNSSSFSLATARAALASLATSCPSLRRRISRNSRIERSSSTIRIEATRESYQRSGEADGEGRPATGQRVDMDGAAVGVDDPVDGGEAEPGAALLGGEEG